MGNILEDNHTIFLGLFTALARTRDSAHNTYSKVLAVQRQSFLNNNGLISSKQQEESMDLLDEALHKFYLGAFALEQLWSVHHYLELADQGLPDFYDANMTTQQNLIVFLLSALLDQVLYTWRSFLDYYLKYLIFTLTGKYIVTMSTDEFRKKIENHVLKNPSDQRAIKVEEYIKSKVLCQSFGGKDQCWGDLLRSLRDKTTHQKLIKPSLVEKVNQQGFSITWPTISGLNYSELAQWEFENNAFEMLRDLFPVLYGFKWIPGPYKPEMYT